MKLEKRTLRTRRIITSDSIAHRYSELGITYIMPSNDDRCPNTHYLIFISEKEMRGMVDEYLVRQEDLKISAEIKKITKYKE